MADTAHRWKLGDGLFQCITVIGDGMLYKVLAVKICDVYDGTSNTLMVGELTGDEHGFHRRPNWTYFNVFSTLNGINGPATIPG